MISNWLLTVHGIWIMPGPYFTTEDELLSVLRGCMSGQFTHFIQLSNERTKELEENSTPWIMIASRCRRFDYNKYGFPFTMWYADGESIHDSLYKKVAAIASKIGLKQNYYVNYCVRNAVWGLEYNGIEMVLYYSNEGISLQLAPDSSCRQLESVLTMFIECWRRDN